MIGAVLIDKPPGITSHDVVDEVRKIFRLRRVGHTGTLDPFATGLLVVLMGRATRLAQFLSGFEKEYEAVIRLGYATDSGDLTGERVDSEGHSHSQLTAEGIESIFENFRGDIQQVPPMYSAKKHGGRKFYELARTGQEVPRKAVNVCIHEFEPIKAGEWLKDNLDDTLDLKVRVVCSAGTYVRTLAEDFGKHLGVGAHLAELRRTRIGDLSVAQAHSLEQLKVSLGEESLGSVLEQPDEVLLRFPAVELTEEEIRKVQNGLNLKLANADWADNERVRMRDSKQNLIAVGLFNATEQSLHPAVVLGREM